MRAWRQKIFPWKFSGISMSHQTTCSFVKVLATQGGGKNWVGWENNHDDHGDDDNAAAVDDDNAAAADCCCCC